MQRHDRGRTRTAPGAAAAAPGAPAAAAPTAPAPAPEDPRAAARASLAAGRSASLWWVCAGLVVVLLVTVAVGPTWGGSTLAALLAAFAVARAVLRPGPVALTVRSRAVDTAVLAGLAVGVGTLSQLVPTP